MQKSFLGAAWIMGLVSSVVALAIAGGAVILALVAPVGTVAQLDAWRGMAISMGALVVSSAVLAALTLARVSRGESVVDVLVDDAEAVTPAVIVIEPKDRQLG